MYFWCYRVFHDGVTPTQSVHDCWRKEWYNTHQSFSCSGRWAPAGRATPLEWAVASSREMSDFYARCGAPCDHWVAVQRGWTVEYVHVPCPHGGDVRAAQKARDRQLVLDLREQATRDPDWALGRLGLEEKWFLRKWGETCD